MFDSAVQQTLHRSAQFVDREIEHATVAHEVFVQLAGAFRERRIGRGPLAPCGCNGGGMPPAFVADLSTPFSDNTAWSIPGRRGVRLALGPILLGEITMRSVSGGRLARISERA